jgi:predicted site-specific integrase-resolvase
MVSEGYPLDRATGSEWESLRIASARLGVHAATLRRWVADGYLHPRADGDGRMRFDPLEVDRLRENRPFA